MATERPSAGTSAKTTGRRHVPQSGSGDRGGRGGPPRPAGTRSPQELAQLLSEMAGDTTDPPVRAPRRPSPRDRRDVAPQAPAPTAPEPELAAPPPELAAPEPELAAPPPALVTPPRRETGADTAQTPDPAGEPVGPDPWDRFESDADLWGEPDAEDRPPAEPDPPQPAASDDAPATDPASIDRFARGPSAKPEPADGLIVGDRLTPEQLTGDGHARYPRREARGAPPSRSSGRLRSIGPGRTGSGTAAAASTRSREAAGSLRLSKRTRGRRISRSARTSTGSGRRRMILVGLAILLLAIVIGALVGGGGHTPRAQSARQAGPAVLPNPQAATSHRGSGGVGSSLPPAAKTKPTAGAARKAASARAQAARSSRSRARHAAARKRAHARHAQAARRGRAARSVAPRKRPGQTSRAQRKHDQRKGR
jgi:hypothetical protein